MARYRYDDPNPGHLAELNLTLEPGQEFDAPNDWEPSPNPHPVYKPATPGKPTKSAPSAPEE